MSHVIIGTAGHVDHGKTTLVKALTNIDCDTHKEEKERGITINLGFSHLELPGGLSAGIVDVPGHKDFINTMVSGACGIHMVLFVIAADSGIMPQTKEHGHIITALGIENGIVALTKTDLVDEELVEIAKLEIMEFLEGTSLKETEIVAVSSHTGAGIDKLTKAIEKKLLKINHAEKSPVFRMYIDRIFTVKGFGSVVTGSVLGGEVSTGSELLLLPCSNQRLRVRALERHGQAVQKIEAGDRAAINLIGLKKEDFQRGMLLSDKNLEPTLMVDAVIKLFEDAPPLSVWSHLTFISGTFECQARMHCLDKDNIYPGESAIVQLHLHKAAVLLNKDKFIIRSSSADLSLGGGTIIDARPLHHRKRTEKLLKHLKSLAQNTLQQDNMAGLISVELKKDFRPFSIQEIAEKLNTTTGKIYDIIGSNAQDFASCQTADTTLLTDSSYEEALKKKLLKIIDAHHKAHPILPKGLNTAEMTGKMTFASFRYAKNYTGYLLKNLEAENLIKNQNDSWMLNSFKPALDKKRQEAVSWLESTLKSYDKEKPVWTEIAEAAAHKHITQSDLRMYFDYLAASGKIRYVQNDFMHTDIINKYKSIFLEQLISMPDGMSISTYKELLDGTKRFRSLLAEILEAAGLIKAHRSPETETIYYITEKGKNNIHDSLP